MRGAGDQLSIGERIAFYRRRRGLTQAVLASLVGRSEDWLSKVERGQRDVQRLSVLSEVAIALRVTLGDLIGQPVLLEEDERGDGDDVPAVRDALMAPRRLSRVLYAQASKPEDATRALRLVENVWSRFQAGRIGRSSRLCPT